MPSITSFTGETLLQDATLAEIKKQADLLLKQKDVAGAWQATQHVKKELSGLSAEKVSSLLPEYRKISANLKALALPLLEREEVFSLLEHNLSFFDEQYLPYLSAALPAWVNLQDNPDETKSKLLSLLNVSIPTALKLKSAFESQPIRQTPPQPQKTEILNNDNMFDEKEKQELSLHAEKVGSIGGAALAIGGAGGIAEAIFSNTKPDIDKESWLRRAQALITSRLRDVRTTAQLNEYLGRPFAVGGLGLEGASLSQASGLIEQEYQKLHSAFVPAKVTPPAEELTEEIITDIPAVLPVIESSPLPAPTPAPIPAPAFDTVLTPAPAPQPLPSPLPQVSSVPKISSIQPSVAKIRNFAASDKPRVEDIKTPTLSAKTRTVGAADELKLLTLADFRSWGDTAAARAEITRRVGLLAKESLGSKALGIKQFHSSELFRDYIRIGQAGLTAGKKLSQALSDSAVNPNKLTEDEFFAIASLNSKLK